MAHPAAPPVGTTTLVEHTPSRDARFVAWRFLAGYDSPCTVDAYARDLRDWWAWCDATDVDPLDATRAHVDLYARTLSDSGPLTADSRRKVTRTSSKATIARRLSTLAGFYRYAVEEGLVERSPVAHVRRPKVAGDSPTLGLDRDQLARLLTAAEAASPRDHALACLLALNGLRVSEVADADLADVGTERGHRTLTVTRKGGRRTVVALAPRTAAAVEAATADREAGPLFLNRKGERLNRHDAARVVTRLARAAGLDAAHLSPHSLRHTFVTLAREAGVPLEDVQDAAGHADPRTTRRYDRGRHNLDRSPTYALASFVAGAA